MTNVFISWSGELSKGLAEELRRWIPSVLQFAKPYFTPNDIEKGAKWGSEISKKLADTHIGIICLTRENHQKPWILFEAGALSKDLDNSRLCSILFGMDNADLSGPLMTFQTTAFEKSDFRKLMQSINDAGGDNKLTRETFEEVFEMWWPRLETNVKTLMAKDGSEDRTELRDDREILEEILSLSRLSAKRVRTPATRISPSAPLHIISTAKNLLNEAKAYSDKDILSGVKDISEAIEYISDKIGLSTEVEQELEDLKSECKTLAIILDRSRNLDDEIPF
jgi:hypothetical protein